MAININADTTNGLVMSSDTSGNINIQSGGTTVCSITSSGLNAAGLTGALPAIDGSALTGIASGAFSVHLLLSGTTFTPKSTSTKMYVQVYGSQGGLTGTYSGGYGGSGFSEKYYSSLGSSYSFSIGAGGADTGTSGGTSTFDVMTVTGSAGVTTTAGTTGGVGSGGDFNATGGTGGNGLNYSGQSRRGGQGGDATRAGNGGNGANGTAAVSGGGGGTGGNNASLGTGGAAATSADASALDLATILDIPGYTESFVGGGGGSTTNGGTGAVARLITSELFLLSYAGRINLSNNGGRVGRDAFIIVVEW
jgi:hypothetical protein